MVMLFGALLVAGAVASDSLRELMDVSVAITLVSSLFGAVFTLPWGLATFIACLIGTRALSRESELAAKVARMTNPEYLRGALAGFVGGARRGAPRPAGEASVERGAGARETEILSADFIEGELKKLRMEAERLEEYIKRLEILKSEGKISDNAYGQLKSEYVEKLSKLERRIKELEEARREQESERR